MAREIRVEIVGDARSLEAALGKAQTASQKFQRGLAPVARGAKIALLGIGALGIGASKLAVDFDRTASQIVGLAGVGTKQVEEWKGALLDLAPVVGQAPNELAKALYFVSSSGVDASKALGVVRVSAMAAAAGLGETEVVADAVTSAMNAYAKEGLSAAQATDVLTATVREGKGEASAIAPVLGNILPIASQLGVGFEEVGAAMASMTRLGFDAATAATNLSGVLNSILKPQKQAEEGFKKVGTSSAELQKMLAGQGLLKTLQFLEDRFEGNNAAMAKAFPNVRALRGVLSLVGKAGKDTAEVFKNMEDTTGSLGKAFSAVAETDGFKLDQSMAKIQASAIQMGDAIAPVLSDMATGFSDAAGFAADHETATRALAGTIAGLSVVIIGANSALKVYNSQLVAATIGQTRMLAAARLLGPALLFGGALVGTVALLGRLSDQGDALADAFDDATRAATDYRNSLTTLTSTAEDIKDGELRQEQASVSLRAARRNLVAVTKQYGAKSLEAKQATVQLHAAERELEKAEADLHKSRQKNRDAQRQQAAITEIVKQKTEKLRDEVLALDNRTVSATLKAKVFEDRMRKLAEAYGGAETKAGRAALTVADLTKKLNAVPDKKTIDLVVNADHAFDTIEELRARVAAPVYMTPIIRPAGTGGVQPNQSGGIVQRGRAYVVGERRPEVFVPNTGGRIYPRLSQRGGMTIINNFPNYYGDKRELEAAIRDVVTKYARANGGRLAF